MNNSIKNVGLGFMLLATTVATALTGCKKNEFIDPSKRPQTVEPSKKIEDEKNIAKALEISSVKLIVTNDGKADSIALFDTNGNFVQGLKRKDGGLDYFKAVNYSNLAANAPMGTDNSAATTVYFFDQNKTNTFKYGVTDLDGVTKKNTRVNRDIVVAPGGKTRALLELSKGASLDISTNGKIAAVYDKAMASTATIQYTH